MYLGTKINIPDESTGISKKTIKGVTYVYYTYGRKYDPDKKYTRPLNTTIGKCLPDDPQMMYPNTNYLRFFPNAQLPEEKDEALRSGCLRIGSFIIIRNVIAEYHLDEILHRIIGKDYGLFLDLAAYSIIAENNAGQYYPDYAYNHPLFTGGMHIYSDSKVSDFLGSITRDQSIEFQSAWNEKRDHRERIYVSYDSTNKSCSAGDIDLVEVGHSKTYSTGPVVNYAVAYDTNNAVPLFYEDYPGSIVDVSQLKAMIDKAYGYGYRHIGFILDRGYFSEPNIHYMDKCGYEFIIMMKGMKDLVKSLVLEVKGTFEEARQYSIRKYKVCGITVKKRLFPSDKKERYFHIYYNERKRSSEHEKFESRIDDMLYTLSKYEGKPLKGKAGFSKYFDLTFVNEGTPEERFMGAREKYDVINEAIQLCGYFVIITSEKMDAATALDKYKGRDASEKLFRGDKSYLGNKSFRVDSTESMHAKIFIEFVALIIRNRLHTCLSEHILKAGKKSNFMNVPAAIRELEKIELIRSPDRSYHLDHAVTANQKAILAAFGMDASNIQVQASGINNDLVRLRQEVQ